MTKILTHDDFVIDLLKKDPSRAKGLITAAMEDDDIKTLQSIVRKIIAARGGIGKLIIESESERTQVYKILDSKNPSMASMTKVLAKIGYKLTLEEISTH